MLVDARVNGSAKMTTRKIFSIMSGGGKKQPQPRTNRAQSLTINTQNAPPPIVKTAKSPLANGKQHDGETAATTRTQQQQQRRIGISIPERPRRPSASAATAAASSARRPSATPSQLEYRANDRPTWAPSILLGFQVNCKHASRNILITFL